MEFYEVSVGLLVWFSGVNWWFLTVEERVRGERGNENEGAE
jgi:hypothetical protein